MANKIQWPHRPCAVQFVLQTVFVRQASRLAAVERSPEGRTSITGVCVPSALTRHVLLPQSPSSQKTRMLRCTIVLFPTDTATSTERCKSMLFRSAPAAIRACGVQRNGRCIIALSNQRPEGYRWTSNLDLLPCAVQFERDLRQVSFHLTQPLLNVQPVEIQNRRYCPESRSVGARTNMSRH
jgi:hypothetical protein